MTEIVLVTGPLVGTCTWEPTASVLRSAGHDVQIPDVLGSPPTPPAWRDWPDHLLRLLQPCTAPVLIGHSAATVLTVALCARMPVRGVILVDGDIPPASGRAGWGNERQVDFVRSQTDAEGWVRRWNEWQVAPQLKETLGATALERRPELLQTFLAQLPRLRFEWFLDAIDLAPWDTVPAGYVLTSAYYARAADEAERRGWPVTRLAGTHLQPMLEPAQTAAAITTVLDRLNQ